MKLSINIYDDSWGEEDLVTEGVPRDITVADAKAILAECADLFVHTLCHGPNAVEQLVVNPIDRRVYRKDMIDGFFIEYKLIGDDMFYTYLFTAQSVKEMAS